MTAFSSLPLSDVCLVLFHGRFPLWAVVYSTCLESSALSSCSVLVTQLTDGTECVGHDTSCCFRRIQSGCRRHLKRDDNTFAAMHIREVISLLPSHLKFVQITLILLSDLAKELNTKTNSLWCCHGTLLDY